MAVFVRCLADERVERRRGLFLRLKVTCKCIACDPFHHHITSPRYIALADIGGCETRCHVGY